MSLEQYADAQERLAVAASQLRAMADHAARVGEALAKWRELIVIDDPEVAAANLLTLWPSPDEVQRAYQECLNAWRAAHGSFASLTAHERKAVRAPSLDLEPRSTS